MKIIKCLVPSCNNTLENTDKIFISVPRIEDKRKRWCTWLNVPFSNSHRLRVCEDHFKLEEDTENWIQYKTINTKLRLKKNVLPHLNLPSQLSPTSKKRKQEVYQEIRNKRHCSVQSYPEEASTSSSISEASKPIEFVVAKENFIKDGNTNTEKVQLKLESTYVVPNMLPQFEPDPDPTTSDDFEIYEDEATDSEERLPKILAPISIDLIHSQPRMYVGIPQEIFGKLKIILMQRCNISERNLLMTLCKLRSNDSFEKLGYYFGISKSQCGRIFHNTIVNLAEMLGNMIYWPSAKLIFRELPVAPRYRFKNVQSIIDCFEIQIDKPINATYQKQSWSSYKHCNTIKVLISITPNGYINFISNAYAGRISDTKLVRVSGYTEKLPQNCTIMADRGFKHIEEMLVEKNVTLLRPPSVMTGQKITKKDVLIGKRTRLRIHVEHLISRLREFHIISAHTHIDQCTLKYIDFIIKVIAGIVNLQGPLIY